MSSAAARASILHMLPGYLEQFGVDPSDLFKQVGITPGALDSSAVVHRAQLHSALSLAAKVTGTTEIALALGNAADSARLGPAGLALTAGATLEQSVRAHIALMPRLQAQVSITLDIDGSLAVLGHQLVGDGQAAWLLYEGAAAYHVKQLRAFLGDDWSPSKVVFPHACRGRVKTYRDFFNCPVHFMQGDSSRIYFPRDELLTPRPASPPSTLHSRDDLAPIGTFCPVQIERFTFDGHWVHEAVACMTQAVLPHQSLTLATAAARLGLSPRTIQRRLSEMGCAFEDIVDYVRQRTAVERLSGTNESITSIAMSLGYSDTAHFTRAFRRWMGCSPSEFRLNAAGVLAGLNNPSGRPKN